MLFHFLDILIQITLSFITTNHIHTLLIIVKYNNIIV